MIYKNRFKESFPGKFEYGDVLKLSGKLEALPHRRNPGEFDYESILNSTASMLRSQLLVMIILV